MRGGLRPAVPPGRAHARSVGRSASRGHVCGGSGTPEDRQQAGRAPAQQPRGQQGQRVQVRCRLVSRPQWRQPSRSARLRPPPCPAPRPPSPPSPFADRGRHRFVGRSQGRGARARQFHGDDPAARHLAREVHPARGHRPNRGARGRRQVHAPVAPARRASGAAPSPVGPGGGCPTGQVRAIAGVRRGLRGGRRLCRRGRPDSPCRRRASLSAPGSGPAAGPGPHATPRFASHGRSLA